MLHSSAQEVVLRRLEGPELTEQDEARIDAWVARLMGEEDQAAGGAAAANNAAASAGASAVAASAATAAASTCVSAVAPRISPWTLLGHLLWVNTLGGASSASSAPSRSQSIVTLGQLTELWAEMQQLALRIEALQAREDAAAAVAQNGKPRANNGISSVTGSTTTLQRLQVRQREVVNRLKQLQQSLASYPAVTSASASTSAASDSDDPLSDAELHRVCDFPSAALVARGLQVLGVLPRARQAASSEPLVLSMASPDDATSSPSASAAALPTVSIPAARVPPISAYAPRHFLSASHVPLLHVRSLRSAAAGGIAPGAGTAAPVSPTPSRLRALPDVFFHREMFLKTKHKSLPFTVEE